MKLAVLLGLALNLGCSSSVVVGETPEGSGASSGVDEDAAKECPAGYWTDGALCEPTFATLCDNSRLTVVEGASAAENAAANDLAQALVKHCSPSPSVRVATQSDSAVLEAGTGRPIAGARELLILVGGPERQAGLAFLQRHAASMSGKLDGTGYYLTSPEGGPAGGLNPVTDERDLSAVQSIREPASGTPVLSIFGEREAGSVAGVQMFISRLPAELTNRTWWYVLTWQDANGDLAPDANDQFQLGTASGVASPD